MTSKSSAAISHIHTRLQRDLEFFSINAPLMIKDKTGALVVFRNNRAQRHIHEQLEKQLRETGKVRACILKGRQQGCSTYVSKRFYHKTTRQHGKSTFILSHEGKTTDKLFRMVKRYQDYIHPAIKPQEGASNRNQLTFPAIEGDYAVGTAGNENVGRGGTAQLFHGSEAAYWEKAYEIQDGALESIGDVDGTEIILESTANGPNGLFYQKCMDALKGRGDYILIFVPWFWQEEYERPYKGEELTVEEEEYVEQYLLEYDREKACRKVMWRRYKQVDLCTGQNAASGEAKFRQIYPSNPIEAFQASGVGLVRADAIMAARRSTITDEVAARVLGVDPAGDSDNSDRTIIAERKGRVLQKIWKYPRMKPMELAGIVARLIDSRNIDMVFVDRGYGEGTIDRLHELGFRQRVQGIAFNERSLQPDVYLNKRSEILIETAKWLNAGGVRIPDDDDIHADLASVPLDEQTSNGLKFIKTKREIKKILGRSPDIFDAIALTFSYPVRARDVFGGTTFRKADEREQRFRRVNGKGAGPLKSMDRQRRR